MNEDKFIITDATDIMVLGGFGNLQGNLGLLKYTEKQIEEMIKENNNENETINLVNSLLKSIKELEYELEQCKAVADTNKELAEKYHKEIERLKSLLKCDYEDNQEIMADIIKEKQELINYLKSEDKDLKENVVNFEEKLRNTSKENFYYNSYLKTLHRYKAKRELIKEILSKIEKE